MSNAKANFIEWSEELKRIIDGKKVCLFGAGSVAEELIYVLRLISIDIHLVIDNSAEKQKQHIGPFRIASPKILEENRNDFVILIASSFEKEITRQLLEMGISEHNIIKGYSLNKEYNLPKYRLSVYPDYEKPKSPRYLNIGGGNFFHPFWHNLDKPYDWYQDKKNNYKNVYDLIDIPHDLMSHEPFPIASESLDIVYSSYCIQAIHDADIEFTVSEAYRCLKTGGLFRVVSFDSELIFDAYLRNDADLLEYWKWAGSIERRLLASFAGPILAEEKYSDQDIRKMMTSHSQQDIYDFIKNQISETHNHPSHCINWFNQDKLARMLSQSGFNQVYRSGVSQSQSSILRKSELFDYLRHDVSIFMECRK